MADPTPSNQLPATAIASNLTASTKRKRGALLNKFLTKTFHMIDAADEDVARWSNGGTSFTVMDIQRFEKECLPNYFSHSNFTSFIRQLNFYGFQKLRSDPDLQIHTESVRFAHQFFQKGKPELLHKIQRTTAQKPSSSQGVSDGELESLQRQVKLLQEQIRNVEQTMDERVERTAQTLTESYMAHVRTLEASYDRMIHSLMQQFAFPSLVTGSPSLTSTTAPSSSSNSALSQYLSNSSSSNFHLNNAMMAPQRHTFPASSLAAVVSLEKLRASGISNGSPPPPRI